MVTQLLFGEHFKIYEKRKNWIRIKTGLDSYECWIDRKQYCEIDKPVFEQIRQAPINCTTDLVQLLSLNEKHLLPIVLGSSLPLIDKGSFKLGEELYQCEGGYINTSDKQEKSKIPENAYMYINAPYLWGGRSPFGIDCSGYTQVVYKLSGLILPRDAYQQAEIGQTLSFIEESEAGDLAFFDNKEGKINHVGIILDNNRIIHAHGKVRVDKIDHQGILNTETGKYSHKLRIIKKIV